jgi:hypothetical protein
LRHGEPTRTIAMFGQGLAIARRVFHRPGVVAHAANNLPPALLLFACLLRSRASAI